MASTTKVWLNNSAPTCEDDDLNGFKNENNNLIIGSGQSLNTGDLQQSHKAVATYAAVGEFMTGAGIADAYTANAPAPRINPDAREDGMVLRFQAVADNTGACTLNAFGVGVDDIKLRDGTTDPDAGDIKSGEDVTVIDRGTFFELVRAGMVKTTIVTSSDPTFSLNSDTRAVKFTAIAPGGGGGGADDGIGAGSASLGGGGGGGSTCTLTTSVLDASYAIVIAAAGVGSFGSNTATDGGTTTITSSSVTMSADGGDGGQGGSGSSTVGASSGGTGGIATGGDVNSSGESGTSTTVTGGNFASLGDGGSSTLGGGANSVFSGDGLDGVSPGDGGGGASTSGIVATFTGGDGGPSIVIVEEFL